MASSARGCLSGLLLALCLAACANQPEPNVQASANAAATIEILTETPTQAYETLGVLDDRDLPGTPASQVIARLVDEARRLGADAIILENRSEQVPGEQRFNPATGEYVTSGGGVAPIFRATAIRRRPGTTDGNSP